MNEEKSTLRAQTKLHYILQTFRRGLLRLIHRPALVVVWLALPVLFVGMGCLPWVLGTAHGVSVIPAVAHTLSFVVIGVLLLLLLLFACGYLPHMWQFYNDLVRIGFTNAAGEAPFLMYTYQKNDVVILIFESKGFPRSEWQDRKSELETALNLRIARISEGKDCRTVQLYAVPPTAVLGKNILLDVRSVPVADNLVLLGMGLLGPVIIDLDKMAHTLIGGSTGSGKSVLLRCMVWQMIYRGAWSFIADYKGGVEYGPAWRRATHIIDNDDDMIAALDKALAELDRRKKEYLAHDVRSLTEYRQKVSHDLPRIVIACDEVAAMLDKTGATKERKAKIEQIESRLSIIACQGRAFGLHLFLATQRPDANILNGQIKNNMDVRICGKADATLSTIILGNGSADTEIPKDSQGRFIMPDDTLFQGFNFQL